MHLSFESAGDGITPGSVTQTGTAAAIEQLPALPCKTFENEPLLQSARDHAQAMVEADRESLSCAEYLLVLSVDKLGTFAEQRPTVQAAGHQALHGITVPMGNLPQGGHA
jgi:hypothetical protein